MFSITSRKGQRDFALYMRVLLKLSAVKAPSLCHAGRWKDGLFLKACYIWSKYSHFISVEVRSWGIAGAWCHLFSLFYSRAPHWTLWVFLVLQARKVGLHLLSVHKILWNRYFLFFLYYQIKTQKMWICIWTRISVLVLLICLFVFLCSDFPQRGSVLTVSYGFSLLYLFWFSLFLSG